MCTCWITFYVHWTDEQWAMFDATRFRNQHEGIDDGKYWFFFRFAFQCIGNGRWEFDTFSVCAFFSLAFSLTCFFFVLLRFNSSLLIHLFAADLLLCEWVCVYLCVGRCRHLRKFIKYFHCEIFSLKFISMNANKNRALPSNLEYFQSQFRPPWQDDAVNERKRER